MMSTPNENDLYRKGENQQLDMKYSQYKRLNLFAGPAFDVALSAEEGDTLIKVWSKERRMPWALKVHEVSALLEITEKILAWRRNVRREKTRIRVERAREKLREAANRGDAKALRKVRKKKKDDVLRSDKYRKRKVKKTML